jgi:hypothetical protein
VFDVVAVEESLVGAAWEAAPLVADQQSATDGGGNGAGTAADVQDGALFIDGSYDYAAVAGHAAKRFRGNVRAVFQAGGQSRCSRGQVTVDVDDDLIVVRRGGAGAGIVGRQVRRGHVNEGIDGRRSLGGDRDDVRAGVGLLRSWR